MKNICVLLGDDCSPLLVLEATKVLKEVVPQFYFYFANIGLDTFQKFGTALPEETIEAISKSNSTLLGAVNTPTNIKNYKSPIVQLRQQFQLYANVRPCINKNADLVFFRENTEGLYCGRNHEEDDGNTVIDERVITKNCCERIINAAFEYAKKNNYSKITAAHKANILAGDKLFLSVAEQISSNYNIKLETMIADTCAMNLVQNPKQFEIIVTTNMFGDILSDIGTTIIGGLGVAYSGNIGDTHSIFEPVHGSVPDKVGKNNVNPVATILAGKFMLEHLGYVVEAETIDEAVKRSIQDGMTTSDLGGSLTTQQVTDYIIGGIKKW